MTQKKYLPTAMSETPATEVPAEPLFTVAEVEQLSADDVTAGRSIGKMLALLFLYTILAMPLVIWWTFHTIASNHGVDDAAAETVDEAH